MATMVSAVCGGGRIALFEKKIKYRLLSICVKIIFDMMTILLYILLVDH